MALSIVLDGAQTRIQRGRTCAFMQGSFDAEGGGRASAWSQFYFSNVWIDPITYMAMLMPAPVDPAWSTTGTGIYARKRKSDFTLTGASWNEKTLKFTTDYYLELVGTNEPIITTAALGKNQGAFVSWLAVNAGNDDFDQLECGWNSTADGSTGVSLRFWASGKVEVWKDGSQVGFGSIKGQNADSQGSVANDVVNVVLIPCRRNALLIVSNQGGGFLHVFDDVDPTDADPTITAATNFWAYMPTGKAVMQVAPLQYAASGYVCSRTLSFAEEPGSPLTPAPFWDIPFAASTVTVNLSVTKYNDPTTAWTWDGTELRCRLKFDLGGQTGYTPFVSAGLADYEATTALTDSSTTDLTDYVVRCSIDVPDSPAGVTAHIGIMDPADTGASGLTTQTNRPLSIKLGTINVLAGRTEPPHYEETANSQADIVDIDVRDHWKALENHHFRDPLPLDGLTLDQALQAVINPAWGVASFDITSDPFTIPYSASPSLGDWSALVEVGDTSAEWVQRLLETYAATWVYGFRPATGGTQFFAKSPADLGTTPAVTLYDTTDGAVLAGLDWKGVYRSYRESRLEPEANDVRVTGWDPRLQQPIQSWKEDTSSKDPTLAPGSRPDNWLGEIRPYGLFDPAITTQDATDRSCSLLFDRLTPARVMGEWVCQLLLDGDGVPLWRGANVAVGSHGTFRIASLSIEFERDYQATSWIWHEVRYCGEKVA